VTPWRQVWANLMKGNNARCTLGCNYYATNDGNADTHAMFFDGLLDEARVWDDALTAMEVGRQKHAYGSGCDTLSSASSPAPRGGQVSAEAGHHHCTPLIAFWGFNGRQGASQPRASSG
jgi:hypothetical protein